MQILLVQTDIAWEDRAANFRRAEDLLSGRAPKPGALVVLPEMFDSGFSVNVERTADDGASAAWLAAQAKSWKATFVGGVTVKHQDGRARNRALVFGPTGELLAQYDKAHPFSIGKESDVFSGGDRVATCEVHEGEGGLRLCPLVCYDLRFPELFRAGRAMGADVFAVIANWPRARHAHWRALLIARAIENQAFVIGVNRTGVDPTLEYLGGSMLIDPRGEILLEAGPEEAVFAAEIDPRDASRWREKFPVWRDARPGLLPRVREDGRFG